MGRRRRPVERVARLVEHRLPGGLGDVGAAQAGERAHDARRPVEVRERVDDVEREVAAARGGAPG